MFINELIIYGIYNNKLKTCYNMDRPQKQYAKEHSLYDSFIWNVYTDKHIEWMSSWQELEVNTEWPLVGIKVLWGMTKIF